MNIALIDLPDLRPKLYPFALTRPIGNFLVGIMTIQEKWNHYLDETVDLVTDSELLNTIFRKNEFTYDLVINSTLLPDSKLVSSILDLSDNQSLYKDGMLLAAKINSNSVRIDTSEADKLEFNGEISYLNRSWDIFLKTSEEIQKDFNALTKNQKSQKINDPHTIIYGEKNLFIAEGANIKASIINAEKGPVYIDENAVIEEGCIIKGPFYLGKKSKVNAGAVIREACSFGPSCKVGGEVSNTVIFSNSNKGHDGYLGNAVLGEFCNLGAGTNSSNLKNNYDHVKMYDYIDEQFIDSGLQFCGLLMGDHSKSAIGTTFNTGTTVETHCNVFGAGFPRTFIPSFSWGGADHMVTYTFDRAMKTAEKAMARRNVELTDSNKKLFQSIFDASSELRS
ncbi:putative sugar nucleotidyl transferase [Reichenbachiella versicolor]|uniref:putative sugar nucleotidyl transferase n=1 Tax=Reichenbachiella versicolor TaxID=1821036 RepID=UPI000D6E7D8F|nr:putative sugar nucleotidyl transferase [Reichenbachiella versicolor]